MRVLHTSDWHLGRNFHGVNLLDAQVSVLSALIDTVRSETVDVVVVAGDIYDRAIPSADAVSALDHLVAELRSAGAYVVGISGNHDSAVRIGFAERVLSAAGVTLRGDLSSAGQPVLIPERSGEAAVAFYPIPFLDPEPARQAFGSPDARSHERLLQIALDRARADLATRSGVRSMAIAHAFVSDGATCDSELALAIGGSAEVSLRSLTGFDYVALGHLHKRQSLGSGQARYSGSPLPYSFSEKTHVKGAWIVDLPATGEMSVHALDLPVQRPLQQLRGTITELLTDRRFDDAEDAYVNAILTDSLLPLGAMDQLRKRFPHAVLLSHEPPETVSGRLTYSARVKGRSDLDLSLDFVKYMAGRPASDGEIADLRLAIEQSMSSRSHKAA